MDCVYICQAPQTDKDRSKLNKHFIESVKKMSNFIALILQCVFSSLLLYEFQKKYTLLHTLTGKIKSFIGQPRERERGERKTIQRENTLNVYIHYNLFISAL